MRITQGTFSFLPDLTDEQITRQVQYCIDQGWAVNIEFTDDPHPRNTYWDMWAIPMFDIPDAAGVMLRNDGQSPARHEKSRLQEDWLIAVLRPNSVATGWTDRQLDFAPQSPHPSHTRSLINTRLAGASALPRRRLRRFSAAHS